MKYEFNVLPQQLVFRREIFRRELSVLSVPTVVTYGKSVKAAIGFYADLAKNHRRKIIQSERRR